VEYDTHSQQLERMKFITARLLGREADLALQDGAIKPGMPRCCDAVVPDHQHGSPCSALARARVTRLCWGASATHSRTARAVQPARMHAMNTAAGRMQGGY